MGAVGGQPGRRPDPRGLEPGAVLERTVLRRLSGRGQSRPGMPGVLLLGCKVAHRGEVHRRYKALGALPRYGVRSPGAVSCGGGPGDRADTLSQGQLTSQGSWGDAASVRRAGDGGRRHGVHRRWAGYCRLAETGRRHATVCHTAYEWARDDDGDGVREVHTNTPEGLWTGLRNFLRPFRGVSKWFLDEYVGIFVWGHTLKTVTAEFLRALFGVRLTTDFGP